MRKILTAISASLLCSYGLNARAETLVTEHFEVVITSNCEEGEVACDDVTYNGKNLKNGNSIQLKGKTLNALCADGVTPCRFQGYQFKSGNVDYFVHEDGLLEVIQNNKTLVSERGQWTY